MSKITHITDADKADLKAAYITSVARLNAIVTNGPTYTAAQVRTAVVDMAKIQLGLLKGIKRMAD
jgi:hypothetical protein